MSANDTLESTGSSQPASAAATAHATPADAATAATATADAGHRAATERAKRPGRPTLIVFRLAAGFTFLAVALGSVVSATGSGAACPTWPGCNPGDVAPPWALSPIIEFTHRVAASSSGLLILAAALLGLRLRGLPRWVRVLPWWTLVGAMAAAFFGRRVVLGHLPVWLGAVDLTCALTALTAITVAAVVVGRVVNDRPLDPGARTSLLRCARAGLATLLVLHVTGILVAAKGSFTATVGWPMWRVLPADHYPWLQVVRLVATGVVIVLAAVTAAVARGAATGPRLRAGALTLVLLCAAELVLGLVIRVAGLDRAVAAGYAVLASAIFWSFACLIAVSVPSVGRGVTRRAA